MSTAQQDIPSETREVSGVALDPQANRGYTKSLEEKRFLRKLDLYLLTFGCISQVIKYIDQQNINFAYTAGLKEDMHLVGNELNLFLTFFQVGYCLFLIPSQIAITKLRPHLWLSSLEFVWGVLTMALAATKSPRQIYALRFFIGAAESSAYPGTISLLMTWYTPLEMAKRIGFYHSCQGVGAMLAGALQSAIYKGLNGKHGIAGWQWAFIINGIVTLAIAVLGLFMIPDFPDRPSKLAFWFHAKDKVMAEARLVRWQRASPQGISMRTAKQTAKSPVTYCLVFIYAAMLIAGYGCNYLNLFLKSLKNPDGTPVWATAALSAVPIGGYAIQIGVVWVLAISSDLFKTRWIILLVICVIGFPATLTLTIWNVPTSAKYYAYFTLYATVSHSPIIWAWMSDMMPQEPEQRTLTIGIAIATFYAISAWSNVLIYPASQAPHYSHGWPAAMALWVASALVVISLRIYDVKVIRPRNYEAAVRLATSGEMQGFHVDNTEDVHDEVDKSVQPGAHTVVIAA